MQCSKCKNEAIVFQPYSGQHLCRDHFIADVEAKARRAIRINQWMRPYDHIGVVARGDLAGNALIFFLRKLTGNRKDIRVSEIPLTEDLPGLNKWAREAGVTRLARATPLEDAAASALTGILRGEAEACFPEAAHIQGSIQEITPFSHIPAREIDQYSQIFGLGGDTGVLPQEADSLHTDVKAMLTDYSQRHPAAPYAVLNLCEALTAVHRADDKQSPE